MAFQLKEKITEYEIYIQKIYIQKREESMDFQHKEKIAEYQRYVHAKEEAMASELKTVNQQFTEREHKIETELKETKEKLQATTTKYLNLKKSYIAKSEANKTMKKQMDSRIALCRGMYNEGQYYKNGYFSLLNYSYCLQQWFSSTLQVQSTQVRLNT